MKIVRRNIDTAGIAKLIKTFPVTAILGPRQCGKTFLAKRVAYSAYFDLENPRDFAKLASPQINLEDIKGMIVIDEACGMLLSLYFVPFSMFSVILGFFLFRITDILKPWPAKRMEKLSGSMGIMFDDIVAAFYTNAILQIIARFMPYCRS